MENAA